MSLILVSSTSINVKNSNNAQREEKFTGMDHMDMEPYSYWHNKTGRT
jgi:hypothetical protein